MTISWKFWKWHRHRWRTEGDETGVWGECITCHQRFGFVTRQELRDYMDSDLAKAMGMGR